MPSKVPQFKNVRYFRKLKIDDEKGIQPFIVVTEEINCWLVWHVTSQCERLLLKPYSVDGRDEAIDFATMHER